MLRHEYELDFFDVDENGDAIKPRMQSPTKEALDFYFITHGLSRQINFIKTLKEIESGDSVELLYYLLFYNDDKIIRSHVTNSLSYNSRDANIIAKLLSSKNYTIRYNALMHNVIGYRTSNYESIEDFCLKRKFHFESNEIIIKSLINLLKDEDATIRKHASVCLSRQEEKVLDKLIDVLYYKNSFKDKKYIRAITRTICHMKSSVILPHLIKLTSFNDAYIRKYACLKLREFPTQDSIDALKKCEWDEYKFVRNSAKEALRHIYLNNANLKNELNKKQSQHKLASVTFSKPKTQVKERVECLECDAKFPTRRSCIEHIESFHKIKCKSEYEMKKHYRDIL